MRLLRIGTLACAAVAITEITPWSWVYLALSVAGGVLWATGPADER